MKIIPDFFKLSASSKALKKEVLEDVFPRFYKQIELVQKALPLVMNHITQDEELMGKSHVSFYVKLMNASADTHLSMAKSNMSCIKSWFEAYQLIPDNEVATIESLLQNAHEGIISAEKILNELQEIYEKKDVIFQQESPGSEQVS